MTKLIGDRDGEIKVLTYGWMYGMYIDLEKALELVKDEFAVVHDSNTIFLTNYEYPVRGYIKEKVLSRDENKCVYCKETTQNLNRKTHKLLGGKIYSLSNYVVCCDKCMQKKSHEDNLLIKNIKQKKEEMLKNAEVNTEIINYYQNKRNKGKKKKSKKKSNSSQNSIAVSSDKFTLYCDASFKEYKKMATVGFVIKKNGDEIVYTASIQLLHITDSNIAELKAIREGVKALKSLRINKANVMTDSSTAASLLRRRDSKFIKKYGRHVNEILNLQKGLDVKVEWIPRKLNKLADRLSKGKAIAI